jgi:succinoglycan biosynthesis transport protein ExoP
MSRAQRIEAEQRWREAQTTPLMSLPEVLSNPTIQQLNQRSAEAQAALQQELQRRTEQHPSVIQARAQIGEIDRQIEALAANIRNSIRQRAEVARRQEGVLAGTVRQLEGQTLADQQKGVRYNVLKREADTQRQVYQSLLENLSKISVAAALPANSVALLDRAAAPVEPIAPRPELNALLGGGAGLFLALLYLFGVRILDDEVHSPDDLDPNLKLPLLAVLPRVRDAAQALEDPTSALSEAHFSLCAALELKCSREERRALLFTSSGEGEGKTTTAYAVARNFAAAGKRVLLLDADMRRPSLNRYFEVDAAAGLSTVLAKLCPASSAVLETSVPNLFLMPSGPVPPSAAALLAGNRFGTVLRQLGRSFSTIIIDAPPVFGLADAPRLAAAAHSVVFVVEADRTKLSNVRMALRRLIDARANLIGAVLTKMDVNRAGSSMYVYEYGSDNRRELLSGDEALIPAKS